MSEESASTVEVNEAPTAARTSRLFWLRKNVRTVTSTVANVPMMVTHR